MDPNTNLKEQLELAHEINQISDACQADGTLSDAQMKGIVQRAEALAERVEALDGWLRKGGFLPQAWGRSE